MVVRRRRGLLSSAGKPDGHLRSEGPSGKRSDMAAEGGTRRHDRVASSVATEPGLRRFTRASGLVVTTDEARARDVLPARRPVNRLARAQNTIAHESHLRDEPDLGVWDADAAAHKTEGIGSKGGSDDLGIRREPHAEEIHIGLHEVSQDARVLTEALKVQQAQQPARLSLDRSGWHGYTGEIWTTPFTVSAPAVGLR